MVERAGARGRAPLLLKPDLPSAQGEERNRRKGMAGDAGTGRTRPAGADLPAQTAAIVLTMQMARSINSSTAFNPNWVAVS